VVGPAPGRPTAGLTGLGGGAPDEIITAGLSGAGSDRHSRPWPRRL